MSEKNKALINQIIRFGLVGISNTIVSYVIYAVAFALTGYLGPVLNMFVTIPVNFVMNKFWAYRQKE